MKMEFIFDKEKLKKEGYKEERCLEIIRDYFEDYGSSTIKEIGKGTFVGEEEDWDAFAAAAGFPYSNWFLKVIKEWYWYVDEGDGLGERKEDCLEAYYDVKAVNG